MQADTYTAARPGHPRGGREGSRQGARPGGAEHRDGCTGGRQIQTTSRGRKRKAVASETWDELPSAASQPCGSIGQLDLYKPQFPHL